MANGASDARARIRVTCRHLGPLHCRASHRPCCFLCRVHERGGGDAATAAATGFRRGCRGSDGGNDRLAPDTTFSTTSGEHATISLPDGSTLELNSNSLARVDYSAPRRVIHLDRGEAFFKVAHDIHRPFWVVAGNSWVRAVGTAFNVYLSPTAVQVTVGEGTVKVGAVNSLVDGIPTGSALAQASISVLTAGQQADLTGAATATRQLSPAELARSMAWRDGTLYFENQPLGEIVDELGRYTPLQLIVDEKLRRLPMGGTFPANPQGTEALLKMLEQGFGLTVRRESGRVYIEPPPDKRSD